MYMYVCLFICTTLGYVVNKDELESPQSMPHWLLLIFPCIGQPVIDTASVTVTITDTLVVLIIVLI